MKQVIIILLIIASIWSDANSQNILSGRVNEKCKCDASLLDSLLTQYEGKVKKANVVFDVVNNSIEIKERIDFLNSDFKTSVFSKVCEVKCTDFIIKNGPHLGIVDMGFEFKDRNKCLEAIKLSQRQNFQIKVLTTFNVIERKNELVVIYSETPYDKIVMEFFKEIK